VYAALDAAATSEIAARVGYQCCSRYARTQRLVSAVVRWVPGGRRALRRLLIASSRLPFRTRGVRIIGCGTAVTVFLLTGATGEGRLVLKVCRDTLGRRLDVLLADVGRRRATHRRVAGWYDEFTPLLPTSFVIAHCPLRSLPAVACVQHYAGDPRRDLFEEMDERDLVNLASTVPRLGRQLVSFAACTAKAVEREGLCVDLLGRDNLVVVGGLTDARLVLVDHGLHDLRGAGAKPAIVEKTASRLAYLRSVADQVERRAAGAPGKAASVGHAS